MLTENDKVEIDCLTLGIAATHIRAFLEDPENPAKKALARAHLGVLEDYLEYARLRKEGGECSGGSSA
jgi:hypothetical protein